jgi:uncharacterized protein (TIGR03435 family)
MRTLSIKSFKPASESRGRFFPVAVSLLAFALPVFGQNAQPTPAPVKPQTFAYDAIAIKPHKASLDNHMSAHSGPDGFSASGITIPVLLQNTFGLKTRDQMIGLPSWASSDSFDIQAKMDEATADALQKLPKEERRNAQQQMMQTLFADRFGLKVHHESRALPVYNLVVAKGGPKMKVSPTNEGSRSGMSNINFTAQGLTMEGIVFGLSNIVGRQVIDKTGLTGNYDFKLTWTPDEMSATPDSSASGDSGPSIFAAIEDQLGLKLVSAKGPVEVIVVDHIEKPSAN